MNTAKNITDILKDKPSLIDILCAKLGYVYTISQVLYDNNNKIVFNNNEIDVCIDIKHQYIIENRYDILHRAFDILVESLLIKLTDYNLLSHNLFCLFYHLENNSLIMYHTYNKEIDKDIITIKFTT